MSDKYYLKIANARDLENFKERAIYRALEILPGFLVWTTLIGMLVISWLYPVWAGFFVIAFCIYWLFRTIYFSIILGFAYKKIDENLKINWFKKITELPEEKWKDIYHLIIFPMYNEEVSIVKESFQAILNSKYPKDKMIVVLGIEERAGEKAKEVAEKIEELYGNKFYKFLITNHPQDIPWETAGKGSNETWAIRRAKEKIVDAENIPYKNIIVSCFDIDTQVYSHYFSCLTYYFLTEPSPHRCSFQPVPFYLNNIFEAPFFSRVVSSCNVFWQMIQQQRPEKIVTYSSHSMSFKALVEMDYWQTNIVSEDAGIFWKSFLFYDGDYRVVPLHYPVSMDSCVAKTLKQTIINQYKQQRRWAWGSEGTPYVLYGFLKNKKISFDKKFQYGFLLIEGFWAWATNVLIILFLGWLPIMLGGEQFRNTVLSYKLPDITGKIMAVALLGVVVFVIINSLLLRSFYASYWKNKFIIAQWIFVPFSLIIFGAIPAIDAQTRLMLGRYLGFNITEKTRKKST